MIIKKILLLPEIGQVLQITTSMSADVHLIETFVPNKIFNEINSTLAIHCSKLLRTITYYSFDFNTGLQISTSLNSSCPEVNDDLQISSSLNRSCPQGNGDLQISSSLNPSCSQGNGGLQISTSLNTLYPHFNDDLHRSTSFTLLCPLATLVYKYPPHLLFCARRFTLDFSDQISTSSASVLELMWPGVQGEDCPVLGELLVGR